MPHRRVTGPIISLLLGYRRKYTHGAFYPQLSFQNDCDVSVFEPQHPAFPMLLRRSIQWAAGRWFRARCLHEAPPQDEEAPCCSGRQDSQPLSPQPSVAAAWRTVRGVGAAGALRFPGYSRGNLAMRDLKRAVMGADMKDPAGAKASIQDACRRAIPLLTDPPLAFTALLRLCGADHMRAAAVFAAFEGAGHSPHVHHFCALIHAHLRGGAWPAGIEAFTSMVERGVLPNAQACTAAIACYGASRDAAGVTRVLAAARDAGVEPDAPLLAAAVGAFARAGDWRNALESLDTMRVRNEGGNEGPIIAAHACGGSRGPLGDA